MKKRIVFLGAGHAHLYALKRLERFVELGHEPVVVAPELFWYSGLATGVLGGRHPPEQDVIDAGALVRRAGGAFVQDEATRICPANRTVHLARGGTQEYDILSLSLGSVTSGIPGVTNAAVFPVKPIRMLWDLRQWLRQRCVGNAPAPHVLVAGAGVTGCEVAANVMALAANLRCAVRLTLVASGARALEDVASGPASQVVGVLVRQGAEIRSGRRVMRLERGAAVLDSGEHIACDALVNATGLSPAPVIQTSGLPVSGEGGLIVDEHLRSPADPAVHGGGDCIAFQGQALPNAGVFGVRQAPVLFHNLLAAAGHGTPRPYRPQSRYLWIMNLGDGTGLASWGGLHYRGRAALLLKDWIDLRFLRRYQTGDIAIS